ncbi:uncharacterized protein [Nicotiana tomentosiformis]|uniref:uncharacterized protein n=1 Tax=Nicotiana tomentosiformis TaxID=4098 RepID=UPI00388CA4A3
MGYYWPMMGLDVVGPLPKSSGGHLYILVATDYFSTCTEVVALMEAYRTTHLTPTQETPYSLVYGVEAIFPLERQITSLRLAIQQGITDEENARFRLEGLEALDEKWLEA